MSDIEIKAAKERLNLEAQLGEAEREKESAEKRVKELKGDLALLESNPEFYFGMQQKIKTLFQNSQQ